MTASQEKYVTINEITRATGVNPSAIYMFMSRHKIPRLKTQGVRGKQYDAHAYIKTLREKGYEREAEALEREINTVDGIDALAPVK